MTIGWEDLVARVAGWRTHLLGRGAIEELGRCEDLTGLAAALAGLGYPAEPGARGESPIALEAMVRALAGRRLAALARWCGPRAGALALVFDDEDRRSIRALVRGAAEGTSTDQRLAGCLPTPALPLRALEGLAAESRIPAIGAMLAVWGHPFAGAVLAAGASAHPDLLRFELELARLFASRARVGATRSDRALLPYVRLAIDLDNLHAALLLAGGRTDLEPMSVFLDGGREVARPAFLAAAALGSRLEAAASLAIALRAPDLARLARDHGLSLLGFGRAALALRLRRARRQARTDPLSPAPVIAYALALRQELLALRRIIWRIALRSGVTDASQLALSAS
jgi:vacuolar-type H+-ATPase subunit C/Vma6